MLSKTIKKAEDLNFHKNIIIYEVEKLEKGFKELLELVDNCADFRNGIDYNGMDEGNIKCWEIIDNICKNCFNKDHRELLNEK